MKLFSILRFALLAVMCFGDTVTAFAAEELAPHELTVETTAYEYDEPDADDDGTGGATDTADIDLQSRPALARFGPFNIVAPDRAELIGTIDTGTPRQFRAMLVAYPALRQIDMIECPGTDDDAANFAVAHMIRAAGITMFVPNDGSVRSGGVELFLAGAKRRAEPGAEFAVHSWRDEDGLEADDVAANDPVHREYIQFYREMGMDDAKAKAFYAMTNSTPHDSARYLRGTDIAAYIPLD